MPLQPRSIPLAIIVATVATTIILLLLAITTTTTTTTIDSSRRRLAAASSSLMDEDAELPSLFPFEFQDYLGFGFATLGLLLAAGGGIGGGGILVPIYILVLEFPVKHAIPLASTTVLGGAIANNLLNWRKVHPNHTERPAIDWDLILQLEPTTIAGALLGADLNKELPELVLLVLMLLLLTITAQKTLTKAFQIYQQEEEEIIIRKQQQQQQPPSQGGEIVANESTSLVASSSSSKNNTSSSSYDVEKNNEKKLKSDPDNDLIRKQCLMDAFKITLLFVVVTTLDLLQGTPDGKGGGPLGLQSCGTTCYWVSEVLVFACILLFSLYVRSSLLYRQVNGGPILSEIRWDERNTIVYPLYSIVAGLVAGMFGIGGGIVKGPLMLGLGVHPAVASATSAAMILFTSCTATVSYVTFGYLTYDYALFCLGLGFGATLLGQTSMSVLMKQTGQRSSYIAFCIGSVVAVSAIAMSLESALAIWG